MIESPQNLSEKTLACLILDKSGSMEGEPIDELNAGIKEFLREIESDATLNSGLEIAMVVFDNKVEVLQAPALVDDIVFDDIETGGTTAMVDAVRTAKEIVEGRKAFYKNNHISHNRPLMILITDGAPDRGQDVDGLALEIEKATKAGKFMFIPIGVTGADMAVLNRIAGYRAEKKEFIKISPVMLNGTRFKSFFEWLSASMSAVVASGDGEPVHLVSPEKSGWGTFPTNI